MARRNEDVRTSFPVPALNTPPPSDAHPPLSPDSAGARLERLRELFPEAVVGGRVDLSRLEEALGEAACATPERYGLVWAGKAAALRSAWTPPSTTLAPVPSESVNFHATGNRIIEGENLESLKLLQESCGGAVKLIYIDPPYNTGAGFLYPDDFRQPRGEYLRAAGQADGHGGPVPSDPGISGRIHSRWLSMMAPRLVLARRLLREDGFLCVSIDENEAFTLRAVLEEIFGAENFAGTVVWKKGTGSNETDLVYVHEQVLIFRKSAAAMLGKLPRSEAQLATYRNPDGDPRGPWTSSDCTCKWSREERPNLWYPIRNPHTGKECWPPPGRAWAYSRAETEANQAAGLLWWGTDGSLARPRYKRFLSGMEAGVSPRSWWDDVGGSEDGFKAFRELGFAKTDFPHPKPLPLIQRLIRICAPEGGVILDFFAGSGTTAQALLEYEGGAAGSYRFILVQLPEPLRNSPFGTLSGVCAERVRRVIRRLEEGESGSCGARGPLPCDLGFQFFRVTPAGAL